jgi:hypothetical protein
MYYPAANIAKITLSSKKNDENYTFPMTFWFKTDIFPISFGLKIYTFPLGQANVPTCHRAISIFSFKVIGMMGGKCSIYLYIIYYIII